MIRLLSVDVNGLTCMTHCAAVILSRQDATRVVCTCVLGMLTVCMMWLMIMVLRHLRRDPAVVVVESLVWNSETRLVCILGLVRALRANRISWPFKFLSFGVNRVGIVDDGLAGRCTVVVNNLFPPVQH